MSEASASGSPPSIVIDASIPLAWLFNPQQASNQDPIKPRLAARGTDRWWIPGLWHLEVANALLLAERRSLLPQCQSVFFVIGVPLFARSGS